MATLSASLASLHAHAHEQENPRGASPEVTVVKHIVRDMIDSYVAKWRDPNLSSEKLAAAINAELAPAEVKLCSDKPQNCPENTATDDGGEGSPDVNTLGEVGIKAWKFGPIIVVATSIELICSQDDSIYGYGWDGKRWTRLFDHEAIYAPGSYAPTSLEKVFVSPAAGQSSGRYLVLTTEYETWCTSGWHDIAYQLNRVEPPSRKTIRLLDERHFAFESYERFDSKLTSTEVEIGFTTDDIDVGKLFRPAVRRYRIDGEQARRVQPVAEDPHGFTDEWLNGPWRDSAAWAARRNIKALRRWHDRLRAHIHQDGGDRIFVDGSDTGHCAGSPRLHQVHFSFVTLDRDHSKPVELYFLVREDAPQLFTMIDIRPRPRRNCDLKDE